MQIKVRQVTCTLLTLLYMAALYKTGRYVFLDIPDPQTYKAAFWILAAAPLLILTGITWEPNPTLFTIGRKQQPTIPTAKARKTNDH